MGSPFGCDRVAMAGSESSANRSRVWDGVIAVAGATVGLATIIYFVGAVTVWVRLTSARVPPDVAIAHQSRSELISLGVRGVLAVTATILVLALVAYLIILVGAYLRYRWRLHRGLETVPPRNLFHASRSAVRELKLGHFRILALIGIGLVVGTSFINWRVFGIVVALVVVIAVTLRYLHRYSVRRRKPSLAQTMAVIVAAAAAAVAWQANEKIYVQTVIVDPPPKPFLKNVPIPYFGETDKYVYLGDIDRVTQSASNEFDWRYKHGIIEISRDEVELIFVYQQGDLNPNLDSPAVAFWHAIF